MRSVVDANFHAKNLVDALFASLHVAGQEFSLLINLFDDTVEDLIRKRIDADFGLLAELHVAEHGFRDVDADVDLIAFEERGDRCVWSDQVAGTDIENFNCGVGWREHLAFAIAGFVEFESGASGVDIFAAIATFKFFERRLGLLIASPGGGLFFRAITALEFGELVLGVLFHRDGHLPVGLGCVALLLGDEILLGERVVALEVEVGANFIGGGAVDVGLRAINIFLAIAVHALFVFGFGLHGGGARFGNFLGTKTARGFFGVGARLCEGGLQFLVVEGDEHLALRYGIAFADENLIDAATDLGADANVARFDGAGTLQAGVVMEPAHGVGGGRECGNEHQWNDQTLAIHSVPLYEQRSYGA